MIVVLTVWAVVGASITLGARRGLDSPWPRAIGVGFIWPTYPALIAISRIRYGLRRRSPP